MLDILGKDYSKLKEKKLFLFDMDGTLYLGNVLFDGVKELLSKIKSEGGKYVFITNNSSKSVKERVKKLKSFGIECTEENFFTSIEATALTLKEQGIDGKIYVQGTKSLVKGLKKCGINVVSKYCEDAKAIVVGFDTELTHKKLINTCKMLKTDLPYYATNPDWCCPTEFGYVPDCGSMCFGLEKATGKMPKFIGKPEPQMVFCAMQKTGFTKEETLVVGDRIYTDIASGYNAGVDTLLVLSGEATMKDYNDSDIKPTFVLNSVKDLL
jgi:HAD superfamily hydrolase (TIGR01457 family)